MHLRKTSLKFLGVISSLLLICWINAPKPLTIYLIGDSTMANKQEKAYPETGWGMALGQFFDKGVSIDNRAMNGRSTLSFLNENRWQPIVDQLKKGDYVFIEFGHNDEKITKPGVGTSLADFRKNLLKFVTETRAKKATPVLLTPVARRSYKDGVFTDSHGAYPDVVRSLADSMKVPMIDMHQRSEALIRQLGEEKAKGLFNYVDSGHVNYPTGNKDDTHFSPVGAKKMAALAVAGLQQLGIDLAKRVVAKVDPKTLAYDFVVAKDGTGQFSTVQEAINAVPDFRKKTTTIFIKNGVYKEKLVLAESKTMVTLIGESLDSTFITYDDYNQKKNIFGEDKGTSGSSGFYIYGPDFSARNITFENTAGPVGQAVAVFVAGDRAKFKDCRFLGFQDTLYTFGKESRQYYKNCYIEGTVDFIFGSSTAVFDSCTIFGKQGGYFTAASTPENKKFGYVFLHCNITGSAPPNSFLLGRPWRPFAKTVFLYCSLGNQVAPAGWNNWSNPANEKTTYYAEYKNVGTGAATAARVPWAHQLTAEEAQQYTAINVLSGWDPNAAD
ncbi:pectin esterase [Segetibacter sp. 3557_3]|uniref:pectinesterase family protein n=1 Tax=Segetibacter sp. 3557_3 TaxID=2547429 RepID=UPI001058CDD3|nr:pectinesterase family protein [Segetibacter sp. 3557_3]TDH29363.1 pectin esterase [Segetibacter sp. 3557_3]